jgi:hypothetical protein
VDRILCDVTDEVFAALSDNQRAELHRLTLIALRQEPSIAGVKRGGAARRGRTRAAAGRTS